MKQPSLTLLAGTLIVLGAGICQDASAGSWRDRLKAVAAATAASPVAANALSNSEVAAGLKEALAKGATSAVNQLGRNDGFWASSQYRIGLPSGLTRYEATARQFGQGERIDAFQLSLNRAAEAAVPVAADLLGESIRNMSLADAQALLSGGDDAATQYFRRTAGSDLRARFLPLVSRSTDQVGVTKRYKELTSATNGRAAGLAALASQFGVGTGVDASALDLDGYVADKALDALFTAIAEQERQIRTNPAARSSELLKKVFGN
jgi:hypothetical protein